MEKINTKNQKERIKNNLSIIIQLKHEGSI